MNTIRTAIKKRHEEGFSLVEMAIVLVIIGLIVSAIAVGKTTMRKAEANKCVQTFVKPWIEAAINTYNDNKSATAIGKPASAQVATTYVIGGATMAQPTMKESTAKVGMVEVTFTMDKSMDADAWTELNSAVTSGIKPLTDILTTANTAATTIVATIAIANKGN